MNVRWLADGCVAASLVASVARGGAEYRLRIMVCFEIAPPRRTPSSRMNIMANEKGPNVKKKQKCKNCEGKGLLKKGDRVVKCQRCGWTGVR